MFQNFVPLIASLAIFAAAPLAEASLYKVDPAKSEIRWAATKVTGAHNGSAPVNMGRFEMKDGLVTKGEIEINLAKLVVLDVKDKAMNTKLTNHLNSEDFFSTAKHPNAKFVVGKDSLDGETHMLEGKLTIKDKTQDVKFPVTITKDGDRVLKIAGKQKLDRTLWDIRYNSGKYFPNVGDKLIHDEFTVELDLVAETDAGASAKPLRKKSN